MTASPNTATPRRRFPARVFTVGEEPDVRFTLANERTFLAWIRTSLALLAGGVALEVLGLDLNPALRLAASMVLVGAGTLIPFAAWSDWMAAEKALRALTPLPHSLLGTMVALLVTIVGLLVLLAVLIP